MFVNNFIYESLEFVWWRPHYLFSKLLSQRRNENRCEALWSTSPPFNHYLLFCCEPSHHGCILLLKMHEAKRGVLVQTVSEEIKSNCSPNFYWSLRHGGRFQQCFQSSYIKSFRSVSVLYWYISYWPNNASWASTASTLANWGQHSFKMCFKWIKPFPYHFSWHPHMDRLNRSHIHLNTNVLYVYVMCLFKLLITENRSEIHINWEFWAFLFVLNIAWK